MAGHEDQLLPTALRAVREALARYPWLQSSRDDILSDAMEGVRKALATFDPVYGTVFLDWALAQARWQVISGMRDRAPLTRGEVARGLTTADLPPARQDPFRLDLVLDDTDGLRAGDVMLAADPGPDQYEELDTRLLLGELLAALPDRDAFVLRQYDLLGRTLRDIGVELEVSESRVCQIRRDALRRLRPIAIRAMRTRDTTPAAPRPTPPPECEPERWLLSRADAAFLLGVELRVFNRWMREEGISGVLDERGRLRYDEADLSRILGNATVPAQRMPNAPAAVPAQREGPPA